MSVFKSQRDLVKRKQQMYSNTGYNGNTYYSPEINVEEHFYCNLIGISESRRNEIKSERRLQPINFPFVMFTDPDSGLYGRKRVLTEKEIRAAKLAAALATLDMDAI